MLESCYLENGAKCSTNRGNVVHLQLSCQDVVLTPQPQPDYHQVGSTKTLQLWATKIYPAISYHTRCFVRQLSRD